MKASRECLLKGTLAYLKLKVQVHKCNYTEYEENKRLKHRAANFSWMRSRLLVSVVVMTFQTNEVYSNLGLTKV